MSSRLKELILRLAFREKHDPSWMRPLRLSLKEVKSDYEEAVLRLDKLESLHTWSTDRIAAEPDDMWVRWDDVKEILG